MFLDTCTPSMPQGADLSCCKNTRIRCNERAFEEIYHLEPIAQEHDTSENVEDSHDDIDSILDDIKCVQTDDSEVIALPAGLDIHTILTNIYVQDAETTVQKQTNCVIDTLLTGNFDYDILDNFRENEIVIGATSSIPQTLVETAVKQNISTGLTNITDKMFLFFMSSQSVEVLLDEMTDRVNAIEALHKVLTEKFMMVMLNQYRKDILSC
ncbi:uncharacterized protein LOC133199088 [Saccostrea echinata]|uniref:uncharacterized protein LOC133199088 n=1 Tax=Saccostrea echinata TaxID=191078 RepID=UPI002A7F54DD|nr:uncharacterized protein LOC133199088 [Saccostrea echinata]